MYDDDVSNEANEIIDLRSYCLRLLRQWLRALPAFLVVLAIAVPIILTRDESWQAKAIVGAVAPRPSTEAEAIYLSSVLESTVLADVQVAQVNPQIAHAVVGQHPELDAMQLGNLVEVRQAGGLAILFTAHGNSAQTATLLANDFAEAFRTHVAARDAAESGVTKYQLTAPADVDKAEKTSSRITMAFLGLVTAFAAWLIAAAALDVRAQRKRNAA